MVKYSRLPCGSAMTIVAAVVADNVTGVFTRCCEAIVATDAVPGYIEVVKLYLCPGQVNVACITFCLGRLMIAG